MQKGSRKANQIVIGRKKHAASKNICSRKKEKKQEKAKIEAGDNKIRRMIARSERDFSKNERWKECRRRRIMVGGSNEVVAHKQDPPGSYLVHIKKERADYNCM